MNTIQFIHLNKSVDTSINSYEVTAIFRVNNPISNRLRLLYIDKLKTNFMVALNCCE